MPVKTPITLVHLMFVWWLFLASCFATELIDGVPQSVSDVSNAQFTYYVNGHHQNLNVRTYVTLTDISATSTVRVSVEIDGTTFIDNVEYVTAISIDETSDTINKPHTITISSTSTFSTTIQAAGAIQVTDCSPVEFDTSSDGQMTHFFYEAENTQFSHEDNCTITSILKVLSNDDVEIYIGNTPNSLSKAQFNEYSLFNYIPILEDGTVHFQALSLGLKNTSSLQTFFSTQLSSDCTGIPKTFSSVKKGSFALYRVLQLSSSVSALPLSIIELSSFKGTMDLYTDICASSEDKVMSLQSGGNIVLSDDWSSVNFHYIIQYDLEDTEDVTVTHYDVNSLSASNQYFQHGTKHYSTFSLCGLTSETTVTTSVVDQTISYVSGIETIPTPFEDAPIASTQIPDLTGGNYFVVFDGDINGVVTSTFTTTNDIFELPEEGLQRISCSSAVYSVDVNNGTMDYFLVMKSLEVDPSYSIFVDQNINSLNEDASFTSTTGSLYITSIGYPFENYFIESGTWYIKIQDFPVNAHSQVSHSPSSQLLDNITSSVELTEKTKFFKFVLKGWNDEYTISSSCVVDFFINPEYNVFGNPRPQEGDASAESLKTNKITVKYSDKAFGNGISHVGIRTNDGTTQTCDILFETTSYPVIRSHIGFNLVDGILLGCGVVVVLILLAYIVLLVLGLIQGWVKFVFGKKID
ncbi:Uncharacterized protein QTN25_009433 [Entamoeba marina]